MGCGHWTCKDCWCQYLKTKILIDGVAESIRCPDSKCGIAVDDVTVMQLVDENTRQKYQHLMTNSFIQVRTISLNLAFLQRKMIFIAILNDSTTICCVGVRHLDVNSP